MDKIIVTGGNRLSGEISVSGAKNAALPILAASLLAEGRHVFRNVPNLVDVATMLKVLRTLGCETERFDQRRAHVSEVAVPSTVSPEAPYDLVNAMGGRGCLCRGAARSALGPLISTSRV